MWNEAWKQAIRSPQNKFRTGAVLFEPIYGSIITKGCSHIGVYNWGLASVHAERHAIHQLPPKVLPGLSILIVTINLNSNCAISSRPCLSCTEYLMMNGINKIIYPERLNNGGYVVNCETSSELFKRGQEVPKKEFAREMRIPDE